MAIATLVIVTVSLGGTISLCRYEKDLEPFELPRVPQKGGREKYRQNRVLCKEDYNKSSLI